MAVQRKRKAEEVPNLNVQLDAFRQVPLPDEAKAKALLPEVVAVSQMLANTQSVHWIWFTLALAACCGQLSPRDRMELCPSILVPSTLWICLCHPGATNSSGVIRVVSQAMEKLYQRMFEVETEAMKDQNTKPLLRKGLAGGGSLAAAGHAASQPQNRGSFFAAEPEIDGVRGWFSAELAIDKGVPGKLWDAYCQGTLAETAVPPRAPSVGAWIPVQAETWKESLETLGYDITHPPQPPAGAPAGPAHPPVEHGGFGN